MTNSPRFTIIAGNVNVMSSKSNAAKELKALSGIPGMEVNMIISASRRTDIPAFYADWFLNRIKAGYVLVRNPMNYRQVSRVSLSREFVDCVVFWTKNPASLLTKLDQIKDYKYYFQFTLNPYDREIETNLAKKAILTDTFKRLSEKIGKNRVIWRYDPIIINDRMDSAYHFKYFDLLARGLKDHTEKCTISFLNFYRKVESRLRALNARRITDGEKRNIAAGLSAIAASYGIQIDICAEELDFSDMGVNPAKCIDAELIESIIGEKLRSRKDSGQRKACGCAASIDIGAYDTCENGCLYCYANRSRELAKKNLALHDSGSPLLCGELTGEDKLVERKAESCIELQRNFFE